MTKRKRIYEVELLNEEVLEMKVLEVDNNVEVALRSILGFSATRTMKLKGLAAGKEVVVMVNCSATHNFIY